MNEWRERIVNLYQMLGFSREQSELLMAAAESVNRRGQIGTNDLLDSVEATVIPEREAWVYDNTPEVCIAARDYDCDCGHCSAERA